MKTKRMLAAAAALMCCLGTALMPGSALTGAEEIQNRDQVYEPSLILPTEISEIMLPLKDFLWDSEHHVRRINAYTTGNLLAENKVEIVCDTQEVLEIVQTFVKESGLNEALISYRIEPFANDQLTGDGECAAAEPVTNDELESLLNLRSTLFDFIQQAGFLEDSAYAQLPWGSHAVNCYVKTEAVRADILDFMQKNGIDNALVNVIVSPDYDFRIPDGGQKGDEVNGIAASGYFGLKAYLTEAAILSNIYLTEKPHDDHPELTYTGIDITVKTQADADTIKTYMRENYYWDAIVDITVQPDLSAESADAHVKAYICLDGDSNDDSKRGIADVVKLEKALLTADTLTERQAAASDLNRNGRIEAADLTLSKRLLMAET